MLILFNSHTTLEGDIFKLQIRLLQLKEKWFQTLTPKHLSLTISLLLSWTELTLLEYYKEGISVDRSQIFMWSVTNVQ
jgi:hypothetical protein